MTVPVPPTATPLLELSLSDWRQALNQLDVMGRLISQFAPDGPNIVPSTGTFAYRGAIFRDWLGGLNYEPAGTIVCPNNAVSFVQWDPANGVTQSSSLDPLKFAIAEVSRGTAAPSGSTFHVEDIRGLNLIPNAIRWRGAWDSGDDYEPNDVVLSGPSGADLYVAVASSTNQEPPDVTYWELVAFGLPDPGGGDPGDVVQVNAGGDGYELAAPSGSGGAPDIEDEGTLVVAAADPLNFTGDGVEVTDDGAGGVEVHIPGGLVDGTPGGHLIALFRPGGFTSGGVTVQQEIGTVYTPVGSTAPGSFATTPAIARVPRSNRQSAANNTDTGFTSNATDSANVVWRGNAAGLGGFRARGRFGFSLTSSRRAFAGMKSLQLVLGANAVTTLVNLIGFGFDSGDTDWSLYHNDGAGAATKTGTSVAVVDLEHYEVEISCLPNGSDMTATLYTVNERGERTQLYTATVSTELPANTVALGFQVVGNRAASGAGTFVTAFTGLDITGA